MGTRYTIYHWAISRSDLQNLLSVTLDVPLHHSAIADIAYIVPRAMQINRNKHISTNKINTIDQHNYVTNFAYTLQPLK